MTGQPIGVFDSGVGGLSVAREIRALLPAEDILYFADTAYCPYGGRPVDEIRERSLLVVNRLVGEGAKVVVVACNTASAAALETLRAVIDVPVIGMEPALKPAVTKSLRGRVGVMATPATLRAERFDRLVEHYGNGAEIFPLPCPGLVEHVELGEVDGDGVEETLKELLGPIMRAEVDTVVLGCTHYPFLRAAISRIMGPGVSIVDSGAAVARQVQRVLAVNGTVSVSGDGIFRLLTSGNAEAVGKVASRLWTEPLTAETVDLASV
ncbi:MAG TPA: glutamate racemase [Longimicrobiaceae bacterium]|nr:glutamate racemase [Longimicrobiaceae bacterium]